MGGRGADRIIDFAATSAALLTSLAHADTHEETHACVSAAASFASEIESHGLVPCSSSPLSLLISVCPNTSCLPFSRRISTVAARAIRAHDTHTHVHRQTDRHVITTASSTSSAMRSPSRGLCGAVVHEEMCCPFAPLLPHRHALCFPASSHRCRSLVD